MNQENVGKLLLRLAVALLLLPHGLAKLGGVEKIAGMLAGKGLPEMLAYLVYVGEIVAPILLILGLFTRFAGVIVIGNMIFAIFLVHAHELWQFTQTGGHALEKQFLYLMSGVVIALIGPGAYSLDSKRGRR
jgi:putative oxidoreductase